MKKALIPIALAVLVSACSGSADVDAQAALPGTWKCDDDVELVLNPNGRYEWHALYDDDFVVGVPDNDLIKVTAGEQVGTWFPARGGLNAETRWIAFGAPTLGTLHLDAGADPAPTPGRRLHGGPWRLQRTFCRARFLALPARLLAGAACHVARNPAAF